MARNHDPIPKASATARRGRFVVLLAALVGLVTALPHAVAQEDARPADADRACVRSDLLLIADDAAPQFSTGAVRVMWDALPDEERTGPDVTYEVYRIRADDVPESGEDANLVPVTDATFLGATEDTRFRDVTGEQNVTYAWAVVARGDVQDETPAACPGEDIRVSDADESLERFDASLPVECTLTAEALPGGVIRLTWDDAGEDYAIYRSGGNAPETLGAREARVTGGELYTTDLLPGVTYAFGVTVWDEDARADVARCNVVEVTAIPFFGSPVVLALASVGALGAVEVVRRRRKA